MLPKWQEELWATPLWLLYTFIGVSLSLVLAILIVSQTRFGREFWQLLKPCLNKKNIWKIILILALMLVLLISEVRLYVLNTFASNGIYTAMQDLDIHAFWLIAGVNVAILLTRTINLVLNDFFDQSLAIRWSAKLNHILVESWFQNRNYHRLSMLNAAPDNVEQRIQQDSQDFINSTFEFIRGMIHSVLSTFEFTMVLWGLSGVLQLWGMELPKGLLFILFLLVILATWLTMKIGQPLIHLNYENEKLNGNYRYSLIRIREHAESIAFYQGENYEKKQLNQNFQAIIHNRWKMVFQKMKLAGFNDLVTQGVKLLPILLQAPRLFAGEIKIGDVQQTVQASSRLQTALSFFRNFYKDFTQYRAQLSRLHGFLYEMQQTHHIEHASHTIAEQLHIEGVQLQTAEGKDLNQPLSLHANKGESVLIKGASGSGKTSFLRLLSKLWVFGSRGKIQTLSLEASLFLAQRPYMPQGSLRAAIYYPHEPKHHPAILDYLDWCALSHLQTELDEKDDWQHRLSPGELQRIAFVRILVHRPQLIVFDEATSALDEQTEKQLYCLIRQQLPESIIISIGHRSTLEPLHQQTVYFESQRSH